MSSNQAVDVINLMSDVSEVLCETSGFSGGSTSSLYHKSTSWADNVLNVSWDNGSITQNNLVDLVTQAVHLSCGDGLMVRHKDSSYEKGRFVFEVSAQGSTQVIFSIYVKASILK